MARRICILFYSLYISLTAWCNESVYRSPNDITLMLKESIYDIINIEKRNEPWIGSIVKGLFDSDSIRIDSIYLMTDNIPQETASDSLPKINSFLRHAQLKDFPSDTSSITIPGLILGADCHLNGKIFHIVISEFIFGIEKKSISRHSYALSPIIKVIKSHPYIFEYNCESLLWERREMPQSNLCHNYDDHIINNVSSI
jgi:hypothetical protein